MSSGRITSSKPASRSKIQPASSAATNIVLDASESQPPCYLGASKPKVTYDLPYFNVCLSRHFKPFSGRFTPIRPTIRAASGRGYSRLGTRSTWVLHRLPGHCSPASRPPPPSVGTSRGQAMSRPFPAGYCLMPTPELGKSERSPISMIGLSLLFSMAPNRAILTAKTIRLSSLAAARPETIRSQSEALQRQWLQACLPSAAMPTFS